MKILTREEEDKFAPFDLAKTPKFDRKTEKIELAESTYKSANAYLLAAKLLSEKNLLFYLSVILSNASFACELYLKALLHGYNIEFGNTHGLKKLFDKLPEDIQKYVEENITIGNRETEFRQYLAEQNEAFVVYRYMNEAKGITVNHIFIFAFARILQFVYEELSGRHSE